MEDEFHATSESERVETGVIGTMTLRRVHHERW